MLLPLVYYFWGEENPRLSKKITIALDLEWYEKTGGDHVTEVGMMIVPDDKQESVCTHLIIQENMHRKNKYCPTSPKGFIFGNSRICSFEEAVREMEFWICGAGNGSLVTLIWHNPSLDKKVLLKMGISVDKMALNIFDVGAMFLSSLGDGSRKKKSLEAVCQALNIKTVEGSFHNAGNDAYYTYLAYEKLASLPNISRRSSSELARPNHSLSAKVDMENVYATSLHKNIYKGKYTGGARHNEECVIKLFKAHDIYESHFFENIIRIISASILIVEDFNEEMEFASNVLVNQPEIWTFFEGSDQQGKKALCEPFIPKYQKYNSNSGWKSNDPSKWNYLAQALSHYSYHITNGQLLLCNIQGGVVGDNTLCISNPLILSKSSEYGPTDLGILGIKTFFARHKCNAFCKSNWKIHRNNSIHFACQSNTITNTIPLQ